MIALGVLLRSSRFLAIAAGAISTALALDSSKALSPAWATLQSGTASDHSRGGLPCILQRPTETDRSLIWQSQYQRRESFPLGCRIESPILFPPSLRNSFSRPSPGVAVNSAGFGTTISACPNPNSNPEGCCEGV